MLSSKRLVQVIKRHGVYRVGDIVCTGENTAAGYVSAGWAVYEDEQVAVIVETGREANRNVRRQV